MAGVEMIHHDRTERPWDDWSVMEHDDWAHSGETAAVEKIIKDQRVPGRLVFWCPIADSSVEDNVFLA